MRKEDVIARTLAEKTQGARFSSDLPERIKTTLSKPWYLRWMLVGQRRGMLAAASIVLAIMISGVAGAYSGLLDELLSNSRHTGMIPAPPRGVEKVVETVGIPFSPTEASEVLGFAIRQPKTLPEGVVPEDVTVMVGRIESGTPIATISYWSMEEYGHGWQQTARLILRQKPFTGTPWFGAEEHLQGAACNFEEIVLKPGVVARFGACSSGDFLSWQEAGLEHLVYLYPDLGLEEVLVIARSID